MCERRDLLCSYSKGDIFLCEDIEDITRWREDMNFIFEWQNNKYNSVIRIPQKT